MEIAERNAIVFQTMEAKKHMIKMENILKRSFESAAADPNDLGSGDFGWLIEFQKAKARYDGLAHLCAYLDIKIDEDDM